MGGLGRLRFKLNGTVTLTGKERLAASNHLPVPSQCAAAPPRLAGQITLNKEPQRFDSCQGHTTEKSSVRRRQSQVRRSDSDSA